MIPESALYTHQASGADHPSGFGSIRARPLPIWGGGVRPNCCWDHVQVVQHCTVSHLAKHYVPGGLCHQCWASTCWQLLLARNVCMPDQPCACMQYCCCLTLHCCRKCHTHRACVAAAAVLQVCDAICSHPAVGCTPYTAVHTGQDKAGATPRVPAFDQRHSVSRWNSGNVITCASREFWGLLGTSCCSVQQSGGGGVSRSGQFNPVIAYVTHGNCSHFATATLRFVGHLAGH